MRFQDSPLAQLLESSSCYIRNMRSRQFVLLLGLSATLNLAAQTPAATETEKPADAIQLQHSEIKHAEIEQALIGDWSGYLEYRDYSEPPTSTKRVQLPTWLKVIPSGNGLLLHYVYDDGPGKVVDETEQLTVDVAQHTYTTLESGHPAEVYRTDGLDALHDGRSTLILLGSGVDNDTPSEQRVTMTIRRNLVEWLLEVRPAGSQQAFVFRHLYRFTRAEPPAVTAPRKG